MGKKVGNINENLEILRRIAERGLARSIPMGYDSGDAGAVDIFQHLLNEIQVAKKAHNVPTP